MEVIEVDIKTYKEQLACFSIFNSVDFAELNRSKVDELYYLVFRDSKARLGIILGLKSNELYSPFSAPYGGFIYNDPDCKAKIIDAAIEALEAWVLKKGFKKLHVALPAFHYNTHFYTRLINAFHNRYFTVDQIDVNHHFCIPVEFNENYFSLLQRNARKNLNNALQKKFEFIHLDESEAIRAYNVIAINRAAKLKPLRLTLDQVMEVMAITEIDFFVVEHEGNDVAAAIVFKINEDLAQVVYWGDDPQFAELRSMNFLTFKVFEYYATKGLKTLEIGISTEKSIPNYGLSEFKESIGCSISLKYTFSKAF